MGIHPYNVRRKKGCAKGTPAQCYGNILKKAREMFEIFFYIKERSYVSYVCKGEGGLGVTPWTYATWSKEQIGQGLWMSKRDGYSENATWSKEHIGQGPWMSNRNGFDRIGALNVDSQSVVSCLK